MTLTPHPTDDDHDHDHDLAVVEVVREVSYGIVRYRHDDEIVSLGAAVLCAVLVGGGREQQGRDGDGSVSSTVERSAAVLVESGVLRVLAKHAKTGGGGEGISEIDEIDDDGHAKKRKYRASSPKKTKTAAVGPAIQYSIVSILVQAVFAASTSCSAGAAVVSSTAVGGDDDSSSDEDGRSEAAMLLMTECRLPTLILWSILHNLDRSGFVQSVLNLCYLQFRHCHSSSNTASSGDSETGSGVDNDPDDGISSTALPRAFLRAMTERKMLQVLLLVMEAHRSSAPIQRVCLHILFAVANELPEYRPDLFRCGFVPRIRRSVVEHLDDNVLLMAACGTIWHMSNEGEFAKALLVSEQGRALHCLTRVLLQHPRDEELHIMACGALCSFALSSHPYVATQLAKRASVIMDALGPAVYFHSDNNELLVESALVTLLRIEEIFVDATAAATAATAAMEELSAEP